MTEISILEDERGQTVGFSAQGHSGLGPAGEDLLCASITTVFEFLAQGLEHLPTGAVEWQRKPTQPRWLVAVHPDRMESQTWERYAAFLEAAGGVLSRLEDQYPDHCRLIRVQKTT